MCYNDHRVRPVGLDGRTVRVGKAMPQAAEFFWRLFEKTGSVVAYMMYRRLLLQ